MIKPNVVLVLATVALLGFGCAGQQTTARVQPASPTPVQPSWRELEATATNGPWKRDLRVATSADGTTFERDAVFVERAGVPSVIADANGRLVAAFQWFPEIDESWDKVAVSFSDDDGTTWSDPKTITVTGMPSGYQRPFDPTLALTADGKIRMYFTSSPDRQGPNNRMEIFSAISDDGLAYAFETGTRLAVENGRVYDSAALLLNGTWQLVAPATNVGAYHATSADGLTFTRQDDIASTPWNWTGNLLAVDGMIRFYGSGPGKAWWTESADGNSWSTPTPTNTQAGDPAVAKTANGTYVMIFTGTTVR